MCVQTIGGAWEPTVYSSSRGPPVPAILKKKQKKPTEEKERETERSTKSERCPPICLGF